MNRNRLLLINPSRKHIEGQCWEVAPFRALASLFSWVLLSVCSVVPVHAAKQPTAPAFTAEGTISTAFYTIPGTPAVYMSECRVFISSSNGWWQIEGVFKQPDTMAGTTENCRRLPDGVRCFFLWPKLSGDAPNTKAVTPSATAYAISFPPPERTELFVTWLALCPNAELPTTGKGTIRRLLTAELLNHPNNEGQYAIHYLEPDDVFVSELVITNNGIDFGINQTLITNRPPFHNGYTESMYQLTKTTNVNGMTFPLEATYRKFAPLRNASTSGDLFEMLVARLRIDKLTSFDSQHVSDNASPPVMVALDRRPPNLPDGITVNHMVTNDQWLAAKDPRIVELASTYRPMPKKASPHWGLVMTLVVLLTTLPVTVFVFRSKSKNI